MAVDEPRDEELEDGELLEGSLLGSLHDWLRTQAPWWAVSCTAHMAALAMLLLLGKMIVPKIEADVQLFDPVDVAEKVDAPVDPTVVDRRPPDLDYRPPEDITTEAPPPGTSPDDVGPPVPATGEQIPTSTSVVSVDVGGFPTTMPGPGPKVPGSGGIPGNLLPGPNFRPHVTGIPGSVPSGDRAVVAALDWLARHQMRDGSWSLQGYTKMCKDRSCTGPGDQESFSAATAMGVLPFLAAGKTHQSKGAVGRTIAGGIYWLINHQKVDGDLSADANGKQSWMYSHGLATIALCECYGMSHDKNVGRAAQRAIDFIQAAQNTKTGGWRYHPGDEGDMSVVGWQLMALKSAQMAGLTVNPASLAGTKKWLQSVAIGAANGASSGAMGGEFAYQPEGAPSPTMSAVGLLCNQYLRAGKTDPVIVGGVRYLMANLPDAGSSNVYYWYYASQVMHNMDDHDWDVWNRKMRKILVESQTREGCAAGSWDADKPNRDAWGTQGGRIMMTSLAVLTLEVYYRYMPLYRTDKPEELLPAK
jgi:hypothetical protein